ncbi:uncharacterized protein LOC131151134 isoform X2 [Malania oleifera]|uniref:uncharacterized protein LOC131151134 isoform X2 n=1 Tax=Malania oleifera TaxID=397392 RepID=UPI0025ADE313|nr:uncharacterized protein LOC131151134 isoform X2 [Malania oleifera]
MTRSRPVEGEQAVQHTLHSNNVPVIQQQRVIVQNKHGEGLVGILHETGCEELVILCHGFGSSKERKPMANLAAALEKQGISAFHFDFAGNGESEGSFQYGNYRREAEDLRAVVLYFRGEKRMITAIIGHSKGKFEFRVTKESLMERLTTDSPAACQLIRKECRVLTVHGSKDESVPVEDAFAFSKIIPNHRLHIVEGADHEYTSHQDVLAAIVLDFIRADPNLDKRMPQQIGICSKADNSTHSRL